MATTPPPGVIIPIPTDIERLIGPQLLGTLFNFALYGVVAVQVYIYHISFPFDNIKVKSLIYFVFAFETAQTIMNGVDHFNGFARGFGDLLIIGTPGLSPVYTPVMGSIIAFLVQMFFCYRIWVIKSRAWPLCVGIAIAALIQVAGGVTGGIRAMIIVTSASEGHARGQTLLVYLWLVGDAVTDVAIATAMSYFLLQSLGKRSRQASDIVTRIVRLTIETNVLSATIAIISLILFTVKSDQTYYLCPTLFLGKIYSNTLLITFNNRAIVKQTINNSTQAQHAVSTMNNYPTWRDGDVPFNAGLAPPFSDMEVETIYSTTNEQSNGSTGPPLSPLRRGQWNDLEKSAHQQNPMSSPMSGFSGGSVMHLQRTSNDAHSYTSPSAGYPTSEGGKSSMRNVRLGSSDSRPSQVKGPRARV